MPTIFCVYFVFTHKSRNLQEIVIISSLLKVILKTIAIQNIACFTISQPINQSINQLLNLLINLFIFYFI